jgi:AraC-like DNA-binding protein
MIREFLQQLDPPFSGESLFDHLADVVYFIKNSEGQYLVVNQTLVARCGMKQKSQLLGRKPSDVLRPPLGARYAEQDAQVLSSGQPLISQLELHLYPSRETGWCLTTKLPLRNRSGKVVGLVGVSQDLKLPDLEGGEFQQLAQAISYAKTYLSQSPDVLQLASIAGLSRYQLDRRMQRVFGLTTGQWLLKLRIDQAQHELRTTNATIASIALDVGYSDQSAFTRQFNRTTGMSPKDYRNTTQQLAGTGND